MAAAGHSHEQNGSSRSNESQIPSTCNAMDLLGEVLKSAAVHATNITGDHQHGPRAPAILWAMKHVRRAPGESMADKACWSNIEHQSSDMLIREGCSTACSSVAAPLHEALLAGIDRRFDTTSCVKTQAPARLRGVVKLLVPLQQFTSGRNTIWNA